jgi:hypothetical protein
MSVLFYVLGPVLIASSVLETRKRLRRHHYRARRVVSAPAAVQVRLSLVVAIGGIGLLLTGVGLASATVPVLAVMAAIIAWELVVQVRCRRASRAS